jgi:RND family efflux transporter MFP subunit
VQVARVEQGRHQAVEDVVGTVRAKTRAAVEPKVSGRIVQLRVSLGQQVQAGEELAVIDAQEIRARLDQAIALREQAGGELKRAQSLLDQKVNTPQEFEAVQARFRVADAAVKEAEAMLAYTRVTAPFAGLVTRKIAEAGDLAAPGRPLLEIEDPQLLRFEADVPEALTEQIKQGDRLAVRIAYHQETFSGQVVEVAPVADPNSRTFLVKIDLPSNPHLRAGQFGRVAIPLGESPILRIPREAVIRRGQLEMAFVVETNRAYLRLVKTGKDHETDREILAGLQIGDTVVVRGASVLRDGQLVEVER